MSGAPEPLNTAAKDEHLFDDRIEFHGTMGKSAVVRHSRPQRTRAREAQTPQKHFPSRNREQRDSDENENVDGDDGKRAPKYYSRPRLSTMEVFMDDVREVQSRSLKRHCARSSTEATRTPTAETASRTKASPLHGTSRFTFTRLVQRCSSCGMECVIYQGR